MSIIMAGDAAVNAKTIKVEKTTCQLTVMKYQEEIEIHKFLPEIFPGGAFLYTEENFQKVLTEFSRWPG